MTLAGREVVDRCSQVDNLPGHAPILLYFDSDAIVRKAPPSRSRDCTLCAVCGELPFLQSGGTLGFDAATENAAAEPGFTYTAVGRHVPPTVDPPEPVS